MKKKQLEVNCIHLRIKKKKKVKFQFTKQLFLNSCSPATYVTQTTFLGEKKERERERLHLQLYGQFISVLGPPSSKQCTNQNTHCFSSFLCVLFLLLLFVYFSYKYPSYGNLAKGRAMKQAGGRTETSKREFDVQLCSNPAFLDQPVIQRLRLFTNSEVNMSHCLPKCSIYLFISEFLTNI